MGVFMCIPIIISSFEYFTVGHTTWTTPMPAMYVGFCERITLPIVNNIIFSKFSVQHERIAQLWAHILVVYPSQSAGLCRTYRCRYSVLCVFLQYSRSLSHNPRSLGSSTTACRFYRLAVARISHADRVPRSPRWACQSSVGTLSTDYDDSVHHHLDITVCHCISADLAQPRAWRLRHLFVVHCGD